MGQEEALKFFLEGVKVKRHNPNLCSFFVNGKILFVPMTSLFVLNYSCNH